MENENNSVESEATAEDMEKQIAAAVEASEKGEGNGLSGTFTRRPEPPKEEAKAEPDEAGSSAQEEVGEDKDEKFSPDDELLERAIRAGLSIVDTKGFANKEAAERIIGALEAKTQKETQGAEEPADGNEGSEEIDLSEIPELTDEDGYDEKLIDAFNSLRKMVISQTKTIEKLQREGASARAKSGFESLVDTLDEGVRKSLDAAKRSSLEKKFKILSAGYKASGEKISDGEVFKEAANLTLGDLIAKAGSAKKAEALAKRKNLSLVPAGGSAGRTGVTIPQGGEEYADLIADLTQKGLV